MSASYIIEFMKLAGKCLFFFSMVIDSFYHMAVKLF